MRILLTHEFAWPEVRRGTERYLHELGAALAEAGHHVSIRTSAPIAARYEVRGVPVRAWRRRPVAPHRSKGLGSAAVFAAESFVDAMPRRFDVWHANGVVDGAAAAAWSSLRRSGRSVFTDHGFPAARSRKIRPDRPFHDHVVRHIDDYVCVSRAAGDHLLVDYGRTPRIRSGGIDTERFVPAPGARHTATSRPVVLFVGDADEERKGVTELVRATAGAGVETWIAGPGDQAGAVRRAGVRVDDVELLGTVAPDDLVSLYQHASVTALPARAEAFGLVLVESLACGTPVVALDEGGPREIVTDDVGVLAPSADPAPLRDAISVALELAAAPSTGEACRQHAMRWDWRTAVVPDMVAIYEGRP